jgi:hypothetical protein
MDSTKLYSQDKKLPVTQPEVKQQFGEWINCSDCMPEPFVRVLVIDDDSDCFIDLLSDDSLISNEKWDAYTHWMPLPASPPKSI